MTSFLGTVLNKTPVSYTSRLNLSIPFRRDAGPEAQMKTMGSVSTIFAIVNRTSNAVSQVEWKLWRKAASGKDEDRQEVTQHAALDVWDTPNPYMPQQEFTETVQQHIDLTGEGWWVIGRDRRSSIPLELWPVRPDRMSPVPHPTDFLSGYIYTGPDGETVPLDVQDVIFLRMPNPLDIYRGMGPVQSIMLDAESSRFTKEWNRNFFKNSAEPGGVVRVDKRLTDPQFREMRDRWQEQHQGVANAHRVAILENGAEWVERKFTMRDMQFVELRAATREDIREAFGFPKSMLGATDDINRANAEAGELVFSRWLLVPRLERFKQALNSEFLPLFGNAATGLEFDYEDPVPENQELEYQELTARSNAAKTLVDAGFDPTAVLEAVGLPEIEHVGPGMATGAAMPPAGPPEGATGMPSRRTPPATARLLAQQAERESWEERLDALVTDWQVIAEAQFSELAEQVESIVNQGNPLALADLTVSTDDASQLVADAMFAQATDSARRVAKDAAAQGVSISPAVPADIQNRYLAPRAALPAPVKVVEGLAGDLTAAARLAVTNLAKGLTSSAAATALRNWSPGATAESVADAVVEQLHSLTDAALRTELGAAIWAAENEGKSATLEEAEQNGQRAAYYLADEVRDKNTCAPCKEIDGKRFDTLAEVQEMYPFGGYKNCDGRDRCRGTYAVYWD